MPTTSVAISGMPAGAAGHEAAHHARHDLQALSEARGARKAAGTQRCRIRRPEEPARIRVSMALDARGMGAPALPKLTWS